MARPVDPAKIVRDRDLRSGGKVSQAHRRTGQPGAVIDQIVDVIKVLMRQLHRFAQGAGIGRLTHDQPLLHPFVHQRAGDIAIEILIEQRDQTADFGAVGGGAVDHRVLVDRFLEIFADRPAINQGHRLGRIMQHRSASGGVQIAEFVAPFPRVLAQQFIADALLAEQQTDLAAERA